LGGFSALTFGALAGFSGFAGVALAADAVLAFGSGAALPFAG
jgi:hypothetical protein